MICHVVSHMVSHMISHMISHRCGVDFQSKKVIIAQNMGFEEYAEIAIKQIDLVATCIDDLPPNLWGVRLDVASPAFRRGIARCSAVQRAVIC